MKESGAGAAAKAEKHGPLNGLNSSNPASSSRALMIAAAKSQKKMWDAGSLLRESQKEALSTLAEYVATRPLPVEAWRQEEIDAGSAQQTQTSEEDAEQSASTSSRCAVAELYRSIAEAEAAGSDEELADVIDQQRRLKGMLALCDNILEKLSSVEGSLVSLQDQHDSVVSKTSAVHTECEKLTAEKTELEGLAKAIQNRLAHYDELENLQRQLSSPTMQVASPAFLPLLTKIDEAIAHLATNAHFENTAVYLGRFRQLQAKAMAMVKAHVTNTLVGATDRVHAILKETSNANGAAGEQAAGGQRVEGALIAYVQYQAVAEGVKALMMEMSRRAARSWEYGELLDECQEVYFKQRQAILHGPTIAKVHAALGLGTLGEGLRVGCAELCDLCHREHKLLQHFFPPLERGGLPILLNPLCTDLVDTVRPLFLKINNVEELCVLALILKGEILEDRIEIRGESLAPMRACVSGLLNEVQERLTFRAQVYIRDEIQGYTPGKDDLDYPGRLQRGSGGADRRSAAAAAAPGAAAGAAAAPKEDKGSADEFGEWCPVLPRTLSFLSQLYRTVDTKIFEGLAQDAVSACTEALIGCSKTLGRLKGPADGGLFLVMHLLKLREQIVPFDVDFSSTELNLDFSDTRSALASLISSRRSLFTWSSSNALLSLAKAPPRVYHTLRNAKKDLERELKHACESFILLSASQVAEPLVAWVRKADALIPAGAAAGRVSAIREHAFAQPDRVKELVAHLRRAVAAFNAETVVKMGLYLANPQTRGVLLTPIRNNIVDAYARMHTYLLAEYQPEEYIAMGVLAPEELSAALGGHQVVLLSASGPTTPYSGDGGTPRQQGSWGQAHERPNIGAPADLQLSAGGSSQAPSTEGSAAVASTTGTDAAIAGHTEGTESEFAARDAGMKPEQDRADDLARERAEMEAREAALRASQAAEALAREEQAKREQDAIRQQKAEQQAREEARAREAAAQEQAEQRAREAAAEAAREAAVRDQAEREKAERLAREAADRERAEREAQAAAAAAQAEREAREAAAREQAARDVAAAQERAAREAREAEALAAREKTAREAAQAQQAQQAHAEAARVAAAAAAAAAAVAAPVSDGAADNEEVDEYGPWTGYGQEHGTDNGQEDSRQRNGQAEPQGGASARQTSDANAAAADKPLAGDDAQGVAGAPALAARPLAALHRGGRPLAGLHRGSKPAAVGGGGLSGGALGGGGGSGGSSGGGSSPDPLQQGGGLTAEPSAAGGLLLPRSASPTAAVADGAVLLKPTAPPPPQLRQPARPAAQAGGAVFGGGQLPPGFQFVDGELKFIGR